MMPATPRPPDIQIFVEFQQDRIFLELPIEQPLRIFEIYGIPFLATSLWPFTTTIHGSLCHMPPCAWCSVSLQQVLSEKTQGRTQSLSLGETTEHLLKQLLCSVISLFFALPRCPSHHLSCLETAAGWQELTRSSKHI